MKEKKFLGNKKCKYKRFYARIHEGYLKMVGKTFFTSKRSYSSGALASQRIILYIAYIVYSL